MKNANTPASLAEVASYIAATETAPWLVALLRDWIPTLMLSRGVHAVQPSKTKMRKTLTEVAKVLFGVQNLKADRGSNLNAD